MSSKEPVPRGSAGRPAGTGPGLGAFLACWVAGFVASLVAASVAAAATGTEGSEELPTSWLLGVVVPVQNLGVLLAVMVWSARSGSGRLDRDLGWLVHRRDWWWFPVGCGIQVLTSLALLPLAQLLDIDDDAQEILERLEEDRSGWIVLIAVLSAVVVAPAVEELLYRGMLLRALQRRLDDARAIGLTSLIFAAVHVLGVGSPAEGVLVVVGLLPLSLLLGWFAVRDGTLSRCILVHAGFNLVGVLAALG